MAKSKDAFRTIGEVADWLETPAHVLRFWESKFTQIKPVKRAGGRRYYRPADMALLGGIKVLLHDDGMTIKGTQKLLREKGVRHVQGMSPVLPGEEIEAGAAVEEIVETGAEVVPLEDRPDAPLSEEAPDEPLLAEAKRPEQQPEAENADVVSRAPATEDLGRTPAPASATPIEAPREAATAERPGTTPKRGDPHGSSAAPSPPRSEADPEPQDETPSLFASSAGPATPEPRAETSTETQSGPRDRFAEALASIPDDPAESEASRPQAGALSALAAATPGQLEIKARKLAPYVAKLEALRARLAVE